MNHPLHITLRLILLPGLLVGLLAGCTARVTRQEASTLLDIQRDAWNRGDLAEFVSYYDASMTFCGGTGVTRGTEDLLARYETRYPTAKERGTLTFELIDFRPLAENTALVIGKYALDREAPTSGFFSLIVAETAEGLRILHDHTSETPRE